MKDEIDINSVDIDLSDVGTSIDSIAITGGSDTITLSGLDFNMSSTYYSPGITVGGATGSSYTYTSQPTWSTISSISNNGYSNSNVNIDTNGITMAATADIKIGDRSLSDMLAKMEDRLAILTPDPEKLAKFEALKKAYEHYKLMEKLCQIEDKEDK